MTQKLNWKVLMLLCLLYIHQVLAIPSTYNWREISHGVNAPKLAGASIAFDRKNHQLILFGGEGEGGQRLSGTWVWNGNHWEQLFPQNTPPSRRCASLAHDPITGQLILFGGEGDKVFNDTWTWNGSDWEQLSPLNSPPIRSHASMTFDPITGQLLLFGGAGGAINDRRFNLNDTWTWNGTDWIQLSPEKSPQARHGSTMHFDNATNQLILFGGTTGAEFLNDTWIWNGTTWIQLFPETSPLGRCFFSMTFDPTSDQLILFGGYGFHTDYIDFNDTWTWNGTNWFELSTQTNLSPRSGTVLAYDEMYRQLVLFGGGFGIGNVLNDAWQWVPLPVVTSILPSMELMGDNLIVIQGANFDSVLSVQIGSQQVISFIVDSPTQITVTAFPHTFTGSTEAVNITVTTTSGTSIPSATSQFTYLNIPPLPSIDPIVTIDPVTPTDSSNINDNPIIIEDNPPSESINRGEDLTPPIENREENANPTIEIKEENVISNDQVSQIKILPPLNVQGFHKSTVKTASRDDVCKKKRSGSLHLNITNILTWETNPESAPAAAYKIYRDPQLKELVDVVYPHKNRKLKLKDKHERARKGEIYTYFVVAEDEHGNVSETVKVSVKVTIGK